MIGERELLRNGRRVGWEFSPPLEMGEPPRQLTARRLLGFAGQSTGFQMMA